jgi:hypothetical protein
MSDYKFFEDMGVRVFDNGHSFSGVHFSIHSKYSAIPAYDAAMKAAYGEERTQQILGLARHNTVYYPNLTIKGAIQSIRVVRPIAVDRTLIESWTFRLKGAPDKLLERTIIYNRLINSPFSVVGHDDLHSYRAIQSGLHASGNPWVSLQRDFDPAEIGASDLVATGTSEVSASAASAAAGSEQMSASIREIAINSAAAATGTTTAVEAAGVANERLAKLGDSSARIGAVSKLITAIAEQTNLLALNATIEAARAGEAGKGFAVVADEVKQLASRTRSATAEITEMIAAIQTDSADAASAIDDILQLIGQIGGQQTTVASAVEEQTAVANEISSSVAAVAEAAALSANAVDELRQSTGSVAARAAELNQLFRD